MNLHDLPSEVLRDAPSITALLSASDWHTSPMLAVSAFAELTTLRLPASINDNSYVSLPSLSRPHQEQTSHALAHTSATIHPGTRILGDVLLGPGCEIGPNAVIFGPSIVGKNSYLGPNVEVRRSLLMSNVKASHACYIGHSIIGRSANIGANFVTAVRNLKRPTVHLKLNGELVDTGHELFGCLMADEVQLGVNVTVMPGRCILHAKFVESGFVVVRNL